MAGRLRHRASVVAFAAALALLGAAVAAPAARADTAQVAVVFPGGAQRTLALAALAGSEDVVDRSYLLRSASGESTVTMSGFSLAALIEAAGADPYAFSYLEVQRPDGGAVMLSREQALAGGAAAPVVYATASGTGFIRPASDGDDLNADDSFEAPQGISIVLSKGEPLRVRAEASALAVDPSEKVSFEAIVERAGAGQRLEFSWYFDDGHSGAGRSARHAFAAPGAYDVVVGVTSAGDDTGVSAVVRIQVGEPAAGPNRKGGGTNEAADAPDHGAAAGPSQGSGDPSPTGSATTTSPATSAAESNPRFQKHREREKGTAERDGGDVVSGELLSAEAAPVETEAEKRRAAARTGDLQEGGGGGLPTAAWGLVATLGLLGTGALIEIRGTLGARR
jgi:hypothetical protein